MIITKVGSVAVLTDKTSTISKILLGLQKMLVLEILVMMKTKMVMMMTMRTVMKILMVQDLGLNKVLEMKMVLEMTPMMKAMKMICNLLLTKLGKNRMKALKMTNMH